MGNRASPDSFLSAARRHAGHAIDQIDDAIRHKAILSADGPPESLVSSRPAESSEWRIKRRAKRMRFALRLVFIASPMDCPLHTRSDELLSARAHGQHRINKITGKTAALTLLAGTSVCVCVCGARERIFLAFHDLAGRTAGDGSLTSLRASTRRRTVFGLALTRSSLCAPVLCMRSPLLDNQYKPSGVCCPLSFDWTLSNAT